MKIESAKGKKGFLLYSPFTHRHFFRIYHRVDGEKTTFTDYKVCAEDIEVEILCGSLELYEGEDRNRLDWSRKVLGRPTD
tara:strand:+ start:212 stop:451 length:240 start_codon:yes stop_codon:yes gene_type:complete